MSEETDREHRMAVWREIVSLQRQFEALKDDVRRLGARATFSEAEVSKLGAERCAGGCLRFIVGGGLCRFCSEPTATGV